jgi:homoserine O-acetyltransferase
MKKTTLITLSFLTTLAVCSAQTKPAVTPDRQQFASLGDFKLESGQVIQDCKIGYRTCGRLNSAKTNGILFPSWYGGTAKDIETTNPWPSIDTTRYFLVMVDALGDGVSSSPSNSMKQHGPSFPEFSIRDMVESQHQLLTQKLGINHLRAVMGVSMGGFQTFQWGVSYPGYMDLLMPYVGSPQPGGYDLMLYHTWAKMIDADPAFNHGNYKVNPVMIPEAMGMGLNLTTPEHVTKTMSRDSFAVWLGKIESMKTNDGPDWNDAYYQLRALMAQDIAKPFNGSLKEAAIHVQAKMLIIVSKQDHVVNPAPAIEFSKLLPAKLFVIDSDMGHMAGSFDDAGLKKEIVDFLADER